MNKSNNINNGENKELSEIYKIFKEIYLAAPLVLKDLSDSSVDNDYTEFIRDKIDFIKINTKFINGEYCSITDAIKDIRSVFINCYSFYGARSDHTKNSLKFEAILEEKISCLEEGLRLMADVNITFNLLNMNGKANSNLRYPKDCYDSILLRNVAHHRPERLKEYHRLLTSVLVTDKDNEYILEEILNWENEVNFNDIFHRYISSMWELPEIGNFVANIFKKFNFEIINQGEIERMFLMPKESITMSKIMTTLLMPVKKSKFIGQVMPYKVWSAKLSNKISEWCKVYHAKNNSKVHAKKLLGIHPDFWDIVNEKNPLVEKDYCELSYFMKVWLVKGLCDYVTIKFKTINNIVTNCNEKKCTIWKNDLETEEYFIFTTIPDFRIYYSNITYDKPSLELLESVKLDKKVEVKDNISENKKEKHFKLIADSVEGLRYFVNKLNIEGLLVPESLIDALEEFIVKIEPEECKYIVLNNDSKIKLYKDWTSYADRIVKDVDNISLWIEKNRRSSLVQINEIITEKRCRKTINRPDFELDKYYESDEYVSENDISISEYTDSEDEWGAMNQPKNKGRQSLQVSSKLVELEKRLMAERKMPNHDTENNVKVKRVKNTNTLVNGHNTTSICSTNKDNSSLLEENDSKLIALAENKEICLKKRQKILVLNKHLLSMSGLIDSKDKQSAVNQPKLKGKQPSKMVELGKRLMTERNMPNHNTKKKMINKNTNNQFDTIKNDKSICLVTIKNTENEVKRPRLSQKISATPRLSQNISVTPILSQNVSVIPIQPKNISNIPENGHVPKDIEVTMVKSPQPSITSYFNSTKNRSTIMPNSHIPNDASTVNVKREVFSKTVLNGKFKFDNNESKIFSIIPAANSSPLKVNESYSLNYNLKSSYNSVPSYRQATPSICQAISSIAPTPFRLNTSATQKLSQNITVTPRLSQNISVTSRRTQNVSLIPRLSQDVSLIPIPANVHVPKGIEVTVVKSQHLSANDASTVNVKCLIFSRTDLNGEVTFYIRLPNGSEHSCPNELINEYLKQHNYQLPKYWFVPIPKEVAKQYGL